MNIIKKISEALSLTKTEIKIFLFLAAILIAGTGYKFFFKPDKSKKPSQMDYSAQDSLFKAAGIEAERAEMNIETADNKVDYNEEVLDFNKRNSRENDNKIIPEENSINLNEAGIEELSSLPGVGLKTAQNIIDFRSERGHIKNVEELLDIKGIGHSKLNKIKKYLYIE